MFLDGAQRSQGPCQLVVAGIGPPLGTNMFRFQQKLKALKAKICMWNREEFGNIFEDKKKPLLELDLINKKGMEGGWNEDMKVKEKDLMGHLEARGK